MKKLKMLTIVLVVILITMIAFGGIYIQKQNRMENIIKNYSYAMDLKGARNIRLKVNQENKTVIKDSEGKEVESSEDLTDDKIKEKGYTKEEIPYNSQESQKEEKKTIPRGPRAFVDTVVFGTERMPCVFCDPCV